MKINVGNIAKRAREASHILATVSADSKNAFLNILADNLEKNASALIEENKKDLIEGERAGLSKSMLDRLELTPGRIEDIAAGVRQVAALPDPVGEILERTVRPNGLDIQKVRTPIGVIGIIFESRPNVTVDCAALCLKSGNASILRGGKEAFASNMALAKIIRESLEQAGLPADSVQVVPTTDREPLNELLKLNGLIDCIIPRGGEGLIRFVVENSTIPVIKHFKGVCHVFIDRHADPAKALAITVNAKTQRPGT